MMKRAPSQAFPLKEGPEQGRISQVESDRRLVAMARGASQHIAGVAARLQQTKRDLKRLKDVEPLNRAYRLGAGGMSVGRQRGRP